MNTRVLDCTIPNPEYINEAAECIRSGGLVAFPTETVYGLGANGMDEAAVNAIFRAKGRPNDNPLILHIADADALTSLWCSVPEKAHVLAQTFWPGPLTIIAKRTENVPASVTAGLDTVAVRMPSDPVARELIRKAGVPIAAPSANLSGKPSPTTAGHVYQDMAGRIPFILDGGPCRYGVESTVITLATEPPMILRPGAVTPEMLSAVIGEVKLAPSILSPLKEGETVASPGMKYKHYAPNAEVFVVSGSPDECASLTMKLYDRAVLEGRKPLICATEQTKILYENAGKKSLNTEYRYDIVGNRKKPQTLCANLFKILRDADASADIIFAEGIEEREEGLAYMNRLLRAAGFKVLQADQSPEDIVL